MFVSFEDRKRDGTVIVIRAFDSGVYPPPADASPMKVCIECGVPNPPNCVGSAGICLDCACCARPWAQEAYGQTSWHPVMEAIRTRNIRLLD